MVSSPEQTRGPIGHRFERELELDRRRQEEANRNTAREKLESDRNLVKNEINNRFGDADDLQRRLSASLGCPEGENANQQGRSVRLETIGQRSPRDNILSELPSPLTPPLTPQAAFHIPATYTLEQLLLDLRAERERSADLVQQLETARAQREQYEDQKDSALAEEEQAILNDDEVEIARLQQQVSRLKRLLEKRRVDIRQLESRVSVQDDTIAHLESELERRDRSIPADIKSTTPARINPTMSSNRSSPYFSRNITEDKMSVNKGGKRRTLPHSCRFAFT